VLRRRIIDFAAVYGEGFEESQRNLYKYFVKDLGCRLVNAGQEVPRDLVELLPKDRFTTRLRISFCVNEDVLLLPQWRAEFIGKGDLIGFASPGSPSVIRSFQWTEHVSWFTTCYWYNVYPVGGCGPEWVADAQFIYLGSVSPLTPEQRGELPARAAVDESNARCHPT